MPARPLRTAARPAKPARTNPMIAKSIGAEDTKSRPKAEQAAKQADAVTEDPIPRAADGYPLVNIQMAASELIPTGQYANVAVGPAKISWWIDPRDPNPISDEEKANVAKAMNDIAEICEIDVVAVQRNLVLESLQTSAE